MLLTTRRKKKRGKECAVKAAAPVRYNFIGSLVKSDPSQELQRRGRGCGLEVGAAQTAVEAVKSRKSPIMLSASTLAVDQEIEI